MTSLSYSWRSPSNLALVKYWGKRPQEIQIPQNPSLSFTLKNSFTDMHLTYTPTPTSSPTSSRGVFGPELEFYFEGKRSSVFEVRIRDFLLLLISREDRFSFLKTAKLLITSSNSFPHSAGMASSASSMSALALCLSSLERDFYGDGRAASEAGDMFRRASYLGRMASGSASRSVYGGWVLWGRHENLAGSSDDVAVPLSSLSIAVHSVFERLQNSILVVDGNPKDVSSRMGHTLMDGHPFADLRYDMARNHIIVLTEALKNGDFEKFTQLVENEAMTLHALMMSSSPSFCLLKPGTLLVLEKIKSYRQLTGLPMAFTMDAGPNVHLLYPHSAKTAVEDFVKEELLPLCRNSQWIRDEAGEGPQILRGEEVC